MSDQSSVTLWLQDLRAGKSPAAEKLWKRYYERLVRAAANKLRDASRRVADEEDVVAAAFGSFCRGVEQGRFPQLDDRDDLWQVLMMLTTRKAANQLRHDNRQKRGAGKIRGESIFLSHENNGAGLDQVVGSEPTPEFAGEISEEYGRLLEVLGDETLREVAVAKMEGYSNDEIAARLGVKTRTVERKLKLIRELWTADADS